VYAGDGIRPTQLNEHKIIEILEKIQWNDTATEGERYKETRQISNHQHGKMDFLTK
jgi:hypothetical protein